MFVGDEGSAVTLGGTFVNPGWLDPRSVSIDWGDGTPAEDPGGTAENVRPDASVTFETTHVYGDNGFFAAVVTPSDDDGMGASPAANFTIRNVAPTAVIDESGTVLVNGVSTVMTHAGSPVSFSGRSTDPATTTRRSAGTEETDRPNRT